MTRGIIRRLVDERGFGFLSSSTGKDIFFHYSELDGASSQIIKEGQSVSYRVGLGAKGLIAKDVKLR